jgi:ATP-dependent RNA helicase SUPV3L1/SUV3
MSAGTFGTTAEEGPLDPAIVEAVESHRFDPLTRLNWRNIRLRFDSIDALLQSLDEPPSLPGLVPAREADDQRALRSLARQPEVTALARHPGAVRLLWEVCQIPDYRKVMSDGHARLLTQCFVHLAGPDERLPTIWIARQMGGLDRVDGDIDSLMVRIAHIRTWTYIAHRADWVDKAAGWQERARGIEDRLSDALHDRITQRFVDRRSAFLVRRLGGEGGLAAVSPAGEVTVDGEYVGRLEALRFVADASDGAEIRLLTAAANPVLRGELMARVRRLLAAADDEFTIDEAAMLRWQGDLVGRLAAGAALSVPRAEPLLDAAVEGVARDRVRRRLQDFVHSTVRQRLAPLLAALDLPLGGAGRGLAFQLADALGALPVAAAAGQIAGLDPQDRAALVRLGVRFGAETVYLEPLLRPEALRLRALLWAVRNRRPVPALPSARRLGRPVAVDPALPPSFYAALGFAVIGRWALRPDRFERFAAAARRAARQAPFAADAALAVAAGVAPTALPGLLEGLGYRAVRNGEALCFLAPARRRRRPPAAARDGHPFARLRELKLA